MGTVTVTIQVGDLQGHQFEELDIIVDTGSTYTAVPRTMLERLGVPIQRSMPSQTADGRIVPVDIGQTIVRLEGSSSTHRSYSPPRTSQVSSES